MSKTIEDLVFGGADRFIPGDPSVGAAEASEEFARQKHEARQYKVYNAHSGLGIPHGEEQERLDAEYLARLEEENAQRSVQWPPREQQDRDSKCQPLTESEALWRIELAILRVARALESSNVR